MKPTPSPNCCYCQNPHGKTLRWIFESCEACDAKMNHQMIDASAGLMTCSCPRCDLLFSVESQPALTPEEREAIEWFSRFGRPQNGPVIGGHAATLRKLLDRLGGGR